MAMYRQFWTSSLIMYLPEGFRSARTGTLEPIRVKSSIVKSTLIASAIAIKCNTALVDPPRVMIKVMAFSNAFFVMMSRGRMPSFKRLTTAAPASRLSFFLAGLTAAWALLPGKLIPMASMALAMVLAVYMPPQEPGPGMAQLSISFKPLSLSLSLA